jgi:cysteine desulfuration protein SufE
MYPPKLQHLLDGLDQSTDRSERIQTLMELAGRLPEVPSQVATRPYPDTNRVHACESQAYVWATPRSEGGVELHYAVENPQGITAQALASILREGLSGCSAEEIDVVGDEIIYQVFGYELSMAKILGLANMIRLTKAAAKCPAQPA